MPHVTFTVHGKPVGQGSMRHVGGGRLIHSKELTAWRETVVKALQAEDIDMITGPVRVSMQFTIPMLKTPTHQLPITRSSYDLDKQVRAIGDALTIARVIEDDSRITDLMASKRYGEQPGVTIHVWSIDNDR